MDYRAFRIHDAKNNFHAGVESLPVDAIASPEKDEVLIRVAWSGVNYKDALAGTGKFKILRKSPLTGGIDLAGTVVASRYADVAVDDEVLLNGSGLSEIRDGGYAKYARVPGELVVPMPAALDARKAMLIGTAGFTAAQAIDLMQTNGQTPDCGPIAVTGASGGVGSFAVYLLAKLGYECVAVSRKAEAHEYLKKLGAARVIEAVPESDVPLASAKWGGAIDNLGGRTLANLLKSTRELGCVASIGLAQSAELSCTVLPLIIRGIRLLGVTSANCPQATRREIWKRLGEEWLPDCFADVEADVVGLEALPDAFERILSGKLCGRILVSPNG